MADRLVLTMDGSTRACGAALVRTVCTPVGAVAGAAGPLSGRWEMVNSRVAVDSRGQAKLLLPMIDGMLAESGRSAEDLGAIVVGVGPGTFTGVRIAVATARALSLALGLPVTGVSTLGAMAAQAAGGLGAGSGVLVPVVDARRGQVFYGVYESTGGAWVRREPFAACDRSALGEVLAAVGTGPVLVVSEEGDLVAGLPGGAGPRVCAVRPEWLVLGQEALREPGQNPEGDRLGEWLSVALEQGGPVVPEAVKPVYVRSPDADIHITKMRDPWAELPGRTAPGLGGRGT